MKTGREKMGETREGIVMYGNIWWCVWIVYALSDKEKCTRIQSRAATS